MKKRTKRVKPIIIDEIDSEKFDVQKFFEKKVFKGKVPTRNIPDGHIRVIVLKECEGMTGHYYEGDIIDLPERRFKSLRLRGLVDEYKGESGPSKER
jgi:hypothetical protein